MPQEEADLFERGLGREIVDVVAAIGEHAAVAVDEADRRRRGDDVFKSALGLRFGSGAHASAIILERLSHFVKADLKVRLGDGQARRA